MTNANGLPHRLERLGQWMESAGTRATSPWSDWFTDLRRDPNPDRRALPGSEMPSQRRSLTRPRATRGAAPDPFRRDAFRDRDGHFGGARRVLPGSIRRSCRKRLRCHAGWGRELVLRLPKVGPASAARVRSTLLRLEPEQHGCVSRIDPEVWR